MRCAALAAVSLALVACSKPASAPAPKPITYAEYRQIEPGMSYTDVVRILGQKGDQAASQEIGGRMVRTYTFGPDGVMIFFDGETVADKMPGMLQAAPPLP